MRHKVGKVVRRVRGLLQHAPLLGTVSGTVRLDEPSSHSVLERATVCPAESIVSASPLATPEAVPYDMPAKDVSMLRDVWLWPQWGVVADSDSRLILDSVFDPRRLGYLESNGVFRRDPVVDCRLPATSIHVGPAWDNHYHWLIDSLPRVFALHHPLVASLPKVVLYVCGRLSEDRARLLAALLPPNVDLTPIEPQVRVRVRQFILLPFLAGDCAGYLPRAYHEFFQPRAYAAFDVDPRFLPRRRILVSRAQAPKRRFLNQAELDQALATRGFEVIHLEDLTLREQIMTFAAAETVVAGHGAGLTNLLFGSACQVLEIFAGRSFAHYRLLAAGLNQPYANVVGTSEEKNADQSVPIPAVLDRLAKMGLN